MVKKQTERLPSVISTYEQYLQHINSIPLLTPDEERELAVKSWENKDRESAHKLVISNLRFVIKIANEYRNYGLKLMDLIQEGNIGLMRAVRTFNPYKNVKLITYAVWWIRSYIHNYIQRNWSMVTLGTTQTQRKLFYKLRQEEQELSKLGLLPTTKLLSSKLGVSEREVESMQQRLSGRDLSLNRPIGKDYEGTEFIDRLATPTEPADTQLGDEEEKSLFYDRDFDAKYLDEINIESLTPFDKKKLIKKMEREMKNQAENLNFELAIKIREKVKEIQSS